LRNGADSRLISGRDLPLLCAHPPAHLHPDSVGL